MSLSNIFDRLQAQENAIIGTRVLAPILGGRRVATKIAGVTCQLEVDSETRGWSVLEVLSTQRAKWLRAATLSEREKYLALLPAVRFLALERAGEVWLCLPAQRGDTRFALNGLAPIRGAEGGNLQMFETLIARFDGTHFWFERTDARRSPAIAEYLRQSLAAPITPDELRKKGLSWEERGAYAFALYGPPAPEVEIAPDEQTLSLNPYAHQSAPTPTDWSVYVPYTGATQQRLARSLAHAGGRLVSYQDRGEVYTVTYQFGAQTHTSTVRADDLSVATSGICLSGRDRDFDLTSLVGVMSEAAREQP